MSEVITSDVQPDPSLINLRSLESMVNFTTAQKVIIS